MAWQGRCSWSWHKIHLYLFLCRDGLDPQQNFGSETLSQEEFHKLCHYFMEEGSYEDITMQ